MKQFEVVYSNLAFIEQDEEKLITGTASALSIEKKKIIDGRDEAHARKEFEAFVEQNHLKVDLNKIKIREIMPTLLKDEISEPNGEFNITYIMDDLVEGKNDYVEQVLEAAKNVVKRGGTVNLIKKTLKPWPSQVETVEIVNKITTEAHVNEWKKELNKIQANARRDKIK